MTRLLHVLGDDTVTSNGIVKGYQATRSTVQAEDPDDVTVDASNWMITLFDEGSSDPELVDVVAEHNDQPPYDLDQYPGAVSNYVNGQFQTYLACSYDPANGTAKTADHDAGFLAPCGLLKITTTAVTGTEFLQIRLAAGDYKGCLSESMI